MAYRQTGIMALRGPNGDFLPEVPLYAEVETNEGGVTPEEERSADWAAQLLAKKIKTYKDGCSRAEREG